MAADLRQGSELAGYRIQVLLARGGMGVVYRATQLSLERQVALKVVAPDLAEEEEFRRRFLREVRVAASLDHPHVLPVYEAGEVDGVLYLAMRFVEGESLAEVLAREGALEPVRACAIVSQVAEALAAAHEAGLVHRDVKPQNVLLARAGAREHAYLCDFGVARRSADATALTKTGGFVGSVTYAAPEQIKGESVDARTDLYALGCLLYECLTGEAPFPKEHEAAVLWAHLNEPPPLPSDTHPSLGESFDGIVERALAKDPSERFSSAGELVAALASETPLPSQRPSPPAKSNLPTPSSSFLGRERELAEVFELLLSQDVRLLTLTGPGGTGKTRLALRAAEKAVPAFPDGVYWVSLAPLRDPTLVAASVAQALEIAEVPGVSVTDVIVGAFAGKRALVLLDNCEHLIDAVASIARALVEGCPELVLAASSRERLGLRAERVYAVPPMEASDSEVLFAERARAVQRDFVPDEHVSAICEELDGLPLAVELAAARTRSFSTQAIRERLGKRLSLLTTRDRDVDERQRTLEATIAWSYELLDPEEQSVFRALSVFAGGCTLDAAEEVAGADVDLVESLLDKSLLRHRIDQAGHDRYWMLETIREYAAERLTASGDEDDRRRHAEFYLALAEELEPPPLGGVDEEWPRLLAETDNLRAAIQFFSSQFDPSGELRLVGSLFRFWPTVSLVMEGRLVTDHALVRSEGADRHLRMKVLYAASICAFYQNDTAEAAKYEYERLDLARATGDKEAEVVALNDLGLSALDAGDLDLAASLLESGVALAREIDDEHLLLSLANNLGDLALNRGEYLRARAVLEEALAVMEGLGDSWSKAHLLESLGFALLAVGEPKLAAQRFCEGLALINVVPLLGSYCLDGLSAVAVADGDTARAARLSGAAESMREGTGFIPARFERDIAERTERAGRVALGDEAWDAERDRGAAMTPNEAVEYAVAGTLAADAPLSARRMALTPRKTNLPTPASSFLGRERELDEVGELVARPDIRLLTLTGPGGVGKTRLALEAANDASEHYPDGVFWVPLAPLRESALVLSTISHVMGVKESLEAHIGERSMLLVLDNFEQVIEAATSVLELLSACPKLSLLVTSRETLRVSGEREYRVPELADEEAVSLFCERSQLPPEEAIAELCRRLDTMPLAIELAAGRTTLFSPEQILDRLSARLDLLKGGRDTDPRQQTLRATIDWSYDLLTDEEKELFARLSVFAGGCTFEAAEEVADADPDTLQSLLEKNLLRHRDTELGPRYWMLETIRAFARERLLELGETSDSLQRHADWALALAETAEAKLEGVEQRTWLSTLEDEQDNIRAALAWTEESGQIRMQLDLVGSIWHFWYVRGSWLEGSRWAEGALAGSAGERSASRAKALNAAAGYAEKLGNLESTRAYAQESLSIFREIDNARGIAWALIWLGISAAELEGDFVESGKLVEQAADAAREAGDRWSLAIAISDVAVSASYLGDHARAISLTREALALFREIGNDVEVARVLCNLADCLFQTHRDEEALRILMEGIALSHVTGSVETLVNGVSVLGAIAMRRDEVDAGAVLLGAGVALQERVSLALNRSQIEMHRGMVEELQSLLGQERFEVAFAQGRAMSLDETVAYALEALLGS